MRGDNVTTGVRNCESRLESVDKIFEKIRPKSRQTKTSKIIIMNWNENLQKEKRTFYLIFPFKKREEALSSLKKPMLIDQTRIELPIKLMSRT